MADSITWTKPEYLQNINTDSNDYYASFTTSGNLYFASSRNGGFGKEDMLLFASSGREDGFGAADLYYARPGANNQWQPAANLGKKFNTPTRDFCPYISPDAQYFFFSNEREIKWISTRYLPK